jgi:hypothetical protein
LNPREIIMAYHGTGTGGNKTCFQQPQDFDDLTMEFPMEFPIDRGRIAATLAFLGLKDMGTPFPQASRIRIPNIVDH